MDRELATSAAIDSVNAEMARIVKNYNVSEIDLHDALRAAWEPLANALLDNALLKVMNSSPEDFEAAFPAVKYIEDFVGVTADTAQAVVWGRDVGGDYREFEIV